LGRNSKTNSSEAASETNSEDVSSRFVPTSETNDNKRLRQIV